MTPRRYPRSFEEAGEMLHALDEKHRAWEEQPPPEHFRNVAYTDVDRDFLLDRETDRDWDLSARAYEEFLGWR